ncbi:MAG: hydrogenase-4 component G [Helicobacter sp.]|nr:hydrogenase-4 component G [Helicobacter sp.]
MKRASKIDAKLLTQEYAMQFMMGATSNSQNNLSAQSALSKGDTNAVRALLNSIDAESIGYKGKPLGSLTAEEAKAMVSGDGYFSKDKTAERIADFVIMGAGDNLNKLQRGREGIERGLKEATKVWGGDLPDISQETVKLALEKVDKRIEELQKAQSALNVEA